MGSEQKNTQLFDDWKAQVTALFVLRYMKENGAYNTLGYLVENLETALGVSSCWLESILLKLEENKFVTTKILQVGTGGTLGRFYKVADGVEVTITGSIKRPVEAMSI